MRHATLQNIAERMAEIGIATFRYNFPYMEHGKGRDSQEVCTTTVRSAVAAAHQATVDLPVLAGGHSFGGRMTSTAASQAPWIACTVSFSSPFLSISPANRTRSAPTSRRCDCPHAFLSGTRDELADRDLLRNRLKKLGKRATLHALRLPITASASSRSRQSPEDVFAEMARVVRDWARKLK